MSPREVTGEAASELRHIAPDVETLAQRLAGEHRARQCVCRRDIDTNKTSGCEWCAAGYWRAVGWCLLAKPKTYGQHMFFTARVASL